MPVPPTTIISHCQFPPQRYLIVRSCFQTISSATWSDTSLPEIDFLTGSWDHWWKWDKMVFRLNAYCVLPFPATIWFAHIIDIFPEQLIGLGFILWQRKVRCGLHDPFCPSRHSLAELTRTVERKRGLPGSPGLHKQFDAKTFILWGAHSVELCAHTPVLSLHCIAAVTKRGGWQNQAKGCLVHKSCNKTRSRVKPPTPYIWNLFIWATGDFFPSLGWNLFWTFSVVGAGSWW